MQSPEIRPEEPAVDAAAPSERAPGGLQRLDLTAAQRGMWFAEHLSSDYSVNLAQYLDIRYPAGSLDHELFALCNEEAGKAAESPYLRIVENDGIPGQVVDTEYGQHVDIVDFRAEGDPVAAAMAWMRDDYTRPVDLLGDQLVVSVLLRVADDRTFWYTRGHHIIVDGFSALTLIRMTVDRYNAHRRGVAVVEKPAATMAEIVADEKKYRTSTRFANDRAHWLERASDLPARVTLSQRSGQADLSAHNVVASRPLPAELQATAERTATELGSSLAVLLTATFGAFLARMSGTDDVVLSLPVTGRATARIKRGGGMLSNVLPVRLRETTKKTVRELIESTQVELTGALRHQRYRSDDIRRDAGLDGGSYSFGPTVNIVIFDEAIAIDGATVDYRILTSGILEDLLINYYQASPGAPLVVDIHGNPHLYSDSEIASHHQRFFEFFEQAIHNLDSQVDSLALLAAGEVESLRLFEQGPSRSWKGTQAVADHLLAGFCDQVARAPDAIAITDGDTALTYGAFAHRCRELATAVIAAGVRPGDKVAVCLSRSVDQVAAVYATVMAGAAYVPLDPDQPASRRKLVLDVAQPSLVIDASFVESAQRADDHGPQQTPLELSGGGRGAAYVIFTSGSTGVPKGVQVSHAAVLNRLAWMDENYGVGAHDSVLYKTPITFDVSVWELFWPLQRGARLVIAAPGGHRDPQYVRSLMIDMDITVVHFVPSMLDVFLEAAPDGEPVVPATVRRIFTSGEALAGPLAAHVVSESTTDLVNLYGPTEAAVDVTEYRVQAGDTDVPIGRPVANTDVYVLDAGLRRVPIGVTGELYLSGIQLADGYVGNTALTAERFIADPFVAGGRMYRTGDLVRWNARGELIYIGRSDFQLKIRGQRVELGEIEATLLADNDVAAVAVVVRNDGHGARIVAYVRPNQGTSADDQLAERLLGVARARLPEYMVPNAIVGLTEFPTNSSGKLDRGALPAPTYGSTAATEYVAPRSAIELRLAEMIEELLQVDRVGLQDNIFALGADSLSAARLASRMSKEFDRRIPLGEVFDRRNVEDLAHVVDQADGRPDHEALHPIARPDHVPTAYAQTRLWFVNRMDPRSPAYNMPGAVRLGPDVDTTAMAEAVHDLLMRHESLRTRFPSVDGEPVQEILDSDGLGGAGLLRVTDVDHETVVASVAEEASTGFDLVNETGIRTALLRVMRAGVCVETVLVVVLHHIVGDGASLRPLIADLLFAYSARRNGLAPDWEPLAVQYADYALWQRRLLGEPDDDESLLSREIAYWKRQLGDAPELLTLPTDHPRPRVPSGHGGYVDAVLDGTVVSRVRDLASRHGVTTFTVFQVALSTVLARLGGTDDVSIGTAVAGRGEPELSDLVGMFVNTVVLRQRISPADSVIDLLHTAHRIRAEALAHAQVPFEQVVEGVAPHRSLSHSPLFQVSLSLQRDHTSGLDGTLGAQIVDARVPAAKYDLSLSATESADGRRIELEFSYATDIFTQSTVERFASYLRAVLCGMTERPTSAIGSIDLLGDAEIADLTTGDSAVEPDTLRHLLAAGESMAAQTAPALAASDGSVSYGLFSSQTNQIARELISRGIGPGDVVVVSAPRTRQSVLATVAVAKTGAAFVIVDPRLPVDRRSAMLTDSGARVGLTVSAVVDRAQPVTGEIDWVTLDDGTTELRLAGHSGAPIAEDELTRHQYVDDVAYLIYTSGSTGLPKAAAVTHRGLAGMMTNQRELLQLSRSSRVLHVASPSFDASVFEMTMALGSGALLVIADVNTYAGTELERLIADHGVTHAVMTPSVLATLDPGAVPSLTTVLSAGEACPPDLARRWVGTDRHRRFLNLYGPTEVTIWATTDGPLPADGEVTIGYTNTGVGALVLDNALRPAPAGVIGELYLTGEQLGLGYLHRPDLTSTRFVPHPFATGARMYRTGDRVMRLPDGRMVFHGRSDFQLKVRGLRIEPGEVDAALTAHAKVSNALSIGVDGPAGETVLVSYVTAVPGSTLLPEQLIEHAAGLLPPYMVPHTISVIDEFELTTVGKIDRSKLPAVDFSASKEFIAPRTQLESVVAEVFAQVLGVERVSVLDGFFELGGNSLSATKVAARLSAALDRQIPVKEIFEASTVTKLAEYIATSLSGHSSPPLMARKRAEIVPVSAVQRGMWLLNRADPASPAYNVSLALRLTGELDLDALSAAVRDLVHRHETLRTSYPMINGEPIQVIIPAEVVAAELDITPRPVTGDIDDAIAAVTGRGFDVTTSAPVRLAVLQVSEREHVIVFVIHHISADGASMAPLARDLMVAYTARRDGVAPAWSPLQVQYADFTLWQSDRLNATDSDGVTEAQRQLDYWTQRLAGAPETIDLPTDRPRPKAQTFRGGRVDFEVPAELVRSLESVARIHNTTLFMVTHAAYAVLLARLSGRTDLVIGTPYAGRGERALDSIVGMFVNSLALRTEVKPGERFSDLLAHVRRDDLSDMAHADVAFESVVAQTVAKPTSAHNPLFQVMFWFQNIDFPTLDLGDLTVAPVPEEETPAKVDLQMTLYPNDPTAGYGADSGTMRGELIYARDLFDASSVETIAARYLRVLEAIAADADCIVGDIVILTADEQLGSTETEASTRSLSELVALAAAAAPDARAIGPGSTFGQFAAVTAAMAATLPDSDAALTMALMSTVPGLAAAGPEALDEALSTLRNNASDVLGTAVDPVEGNNRT
ncbi:amino acid adenylation domain protein [Gordonia bronchialis DSM 43247]|uniref:Amino acid adenylation domain protein n=2 Tax=Gordonia bronchialis TaxID=2054 RepID=D0L2L5_GORB4|nr:amino acid adenylation domain protein [Gordonia bronchialis DSM 43247]QGS26867.1 amino acid adenylation domain-containing protein [Gordonia bronchialis]STQ65864.1 Tyrocidine synthase III [Gordonia bronchialis]